MENNAQVYSSAKIVHHYQESKALQLPEKSILDVLTPHLPKMRVLDVGVGGGRTTPYLAGVASEYTAIDFSKEMIDACKKQFAGVYPTAKFEVCDVRDLSRFESGAFDLVLFSFNGIDNIAWEDRGPVLKEFKRICATGGYFCFSSHNLLTLPGFFSYHFRLHPIKLVKNLVGTWRLRKKYSDLIARLNSVDHASIYDDVYDFGLFTCYVRPSFQFSQLKEGGFKEVRLFNQAGAELSEQENKTDASPWIYYLCR